MSGEFTNKLRRRASVFMKVAERLLEEREYDLACFNADQAAQLYAKSSILRLFGELPRIHGVRELLGYLATRLHEAGYTEKASLLREFIHENRYALSVLEDAYIGARYGPRSFGEDDAKISIGTVSKLVKLLEGIESDAWMV
ncbi:MAG: HEPN domain-containing protein [Candidatus Korarchaeum sp.]